MHRCGCESQCIKPYSLKTCEDEIVLELDKKTTNQNNVSNIGRVLIG